MNTVNIPRLLQQSTFFLSLIGFSLALVACGGNDKKDNSTSSASSSHIFVPTPVTPTPAGTGIWPVIKVSASGTKTLKFEWTDSNVPTGTIYYKLFKKVTISSVPEQIGTNFTSLSITTPISIHLTDWVNNVYIVQACSDTACKDSTEIVIDSAMLSAITYIKASNTEADDWFGWSVAISGDGNTLAVGAPAEDSKSFDVNIDETNNDSPNSGAVYLFIKDEAGIWQQQAYLKTSNIKQAEPDSNLTQRDRFGYQVALSSDGNTLAVSALLEDSLAIGINCYQDDVYSVSSVNTHISTDTGAVYIFKRSDNVWTSSTYVKAMYFAPGSQFGYTLAISGDGKTLAVGTPFDNVVGSVSQNSSSSSTECINYHDSDLSSSSSTSSVSSTISSNAAISLSNSSLTTLGGFNSGAVHIFRESDTEWIQEAFIKASDADSGDNFGGSISLSQDGNTLAVGAIGEDSKDTSAANDNVVLGNYRYQLNNGGVYIFARDTSRWIEQAKIKPSSNVINQMFGYSVALSGDGRTLAVGTPGDRSKASGIDGNGNDYDLTAEVSTYASGATYIFTKSGIAWSEQAYIKASTPHIGDQFGSCVALSHSGNILAVGSPFESSLAKGLNGDAKDTSSELSGAAYVFSLTGNRWVQTSYVKAPNSDKNDRFGHALSVDASGETLMIGAHRESSDVKGVNGDGDRIEENPATASGAVYLY